ncbi:mechanosensitive ion channel family protein [Blautia marasmi]|uniref:mechanosensitive ion channel family protein n=1 Tax=Blautia marasmi TaxID=1917868 RepID=UPI000CF2433E|nr:mechanosensitive ion channel family protein [Blautia marasmi]
MTGILASSINFEKIWNRISAQIPAVEAFAWKVILAIVVYFIASKVIVKICAIIRAAMNKAGADTGVIQFLTSFVKTALYFLLIVSIAVRFGIKESSIAALLASGGVAIGLALQGGLSNLAGGVIIMLLRPFTVGDYIIENTNSQEGTVVKIDLFYTTLSTVDNRRITIPNGNITNSSIVNVTSQDKRKLEIKVMIGYQSDLKKAKGILETLLHADPAIMSEQEMLVFVDELADDGVILGLRAWVKTEDYWPAKWRLNEEIKLTFDEENIDIPYPQLDVHIKSGLPEAFGREERSL